MAEFTEVIKQKERIHKTYTGICEKCAISSSNNGKKIGCGTFITDYPQEAEEIIMKWAEEHPIKTNADKFKEVFGFDINRDTAECYGLKCPPNGRCSECNIHGFWGREYKETDNE